MECKIHFRVSPDVFRSCLPHLNVTRARLRSAQGRPRGRPPSMARRAARWVWDHKRLVVGTSLAAAGAYTGYVLWQKKLELDALCEELMGTQAAPVARNEESR